MDSTDCPDISTVDAIAQLDYETELGLGPGDAQRVRAALDASMQLQGLSTQIAKELEDACANLARALDTSPKGEDVTSVCGAAAKAIGELKAKAGGNLRLVVTPPKCAVSMGAMAECMASCDERVQPGTMIVSCEGGELIGLCDAQCSGACEMRDGASCHGTCDGSCDAGFKGSCRGTCDGTCRGASRNGVCEGMCEGRCDEGKGECQGGCRGDCLLPAGAPCDGVCRGSCAVEFKTPMCTGELNQTPASPECAADCRTKVTRALECTSGRVVLTVHDAKDSAAAKKLEEVLEAHFPAILKVSIGMKDRARGTVDAVRAAMEVIQDETRGVAKGRPEETARIRLCLSAAIKDLERAADSIQRSIDMSVSVQASSFAE